MEHAAKYSGLIAGAALLSACGGHREAPAELGRVAPPMLGWRLPKTVLDVTVRFVPTSCIDDATKGPVIDVKVSAEAIARAVPDPDLGGGFPNGLVQIDTGDLASFWTDASVSYAVHPDSGGLLKSLSSHPVNQAGTIVGNFVSGAVKIATAAAVPGPVAVGAAKCGDAFKTLKEIEAIRTRMPGEPKQKAEDDAQRLVSLREAITITVKRTIDTLTTPPDEAGLLTGLSPDLDDMVGHKWKSLKGSADPRHVVYLLLDFEHANMLAPLNCGDGRTTCARTPSHLPAGALFRQAAYVPVVFRLASIGNDGRPVREGGRLVLAADPVGTEKVVPFGQYGTPRTLPLKVGAFRDTNWVLEFSQTGEITSSAYGSKASGVGLSAAFSGAASAAAEIDALAGKAAAALDTETLRLQTANARLKAETDNHDLQAKRALQTAGDPDE